MTIEDKIIIIAGGGPIGMYLAILLAKLVKKIVIIEKRNLPFKRNQIVVFDINKIGISLRKEVLTKLKQHSVCFVEPPAKTLGLTCHVNDKSLISCPLNILETVLNDILKNYRNISIMRNNKITKINQDQGNITIEDINGNVKDMKYNILIGADGKNSIVKNTFSEHFKETFIISLNDNVYGAIIVFKIDPKRIVLRQKPVLTNFLHKRARIFQHKSGIIYVGLALTEEEYLLENNESILQVAYEYLKINDITVSEKDLHCLNKFKNKVSYCNTCCYRYKNNLHVLIGDACFNAHFFTGSAFNAHFEACHELVRLLRSDYKDCNKHNLYRESIAFNRARSLQYTLKFGKFTNTNDVLEKAKKLKIPSKIIKSLSAKELFYLVS